MRTVDLHAVKAALLRSRGGFAERGDEPVDLLHGQSARDVGDGGLFERRRGDGVRVVSLEGALTAGVVELRAHQTAGGVHLADGLGPCGHLIVVPERADDRVAAGVGRDAEILREDMALTTRRFFSSRLPILPGSNTFFSSIVYLLFCTHTPDPDAARQRGRSQSLVYFYQKIFVISITHFFVTMNQRVSTYKKVRNC